ncbi:MAG: hypothetical protein NZ844_12385, partial [Chloroherpetonaceae bacterium]|nr:hypothetical protein [Chloroherpetonaceae bacterium]
VAFALFAFSTPSVAQVYKLKSTGFSYKVKNGDTWSRWSDWEDSGLLITIDLDKARITIFSKDTQVYNIARNEGTSHDSDGDETLSLYCVDKKGLNCRVRLVQLHSQGGRLQLYVDYNDIMWGYNVVSLD